jgi:hypothetical protein
MVMMMCCHSPDDNDDNVLNALAVNTTGVNGLPCPTLPNDDDAPDVFIINTARYQQGAMSPLCSHLTKQQKCATMSIDVCPAFARLQGGRIELDMYVS